MEGLALDSQDSRRPARGRNGVNASCIHLVDVNRARLTRGRRRVPNPPTRIRAVVMVNIEVWGGGRGSSTNPS